MLWICENIWQENKDTGEKMYEKLNMTKKAADRLVILFSVLLLVMFAYIVITGSTYSENDTSITAETQKNP